MDVVNGELCDLIEYVHECLCALVNLVNCVLDDVLLYLYLGEFKWWCLFWWNDEVWIICMCLDDLFGDDNFLVCPLKCW